MKTKLVRRWWCDHCKKGSLRKDCMVRHEGSCVYNPSRVCTTCVWAKLKQSQIAYLIRALGTGDEAGIVALRATANECPACMLAAVVQSGVQEIIEEQDNWVRWSYKEEKSKFWTTHNPDYTDYGL